MKKVKCSRADKYPFCSACPHNAPHISYEECDKGPCTIDGGKQVMVQCKEERDELKRSLEDEYKMQGL